MISQELAETEASVETTIPHRPLENCSWSTQSIETALSSNEPFVQTMKSLHGILVKTTQNNLFGTHTIKFYVQVIMYIFVSYI